MFKIVRQIPKIARDVTRFSTVLKTDGSKSTYKYESLYESELKTAMESFKIIVNDLTCDNPLLKNMPYASQRLRTNLEYNVPSGKLRRVCFILDMYNSMTHGQNKTSYDTHKACVLGWCAELINTHFLTSDDMIDGSLMRRNKQAWCTLPSIGVTAIYDVCLEAVSLFILLKKYFGNEPYYLDLCNMFDETLYRTYCGQHLDAEGAREDNLNFASYNHLLMTKSSYYSYVLPFESCALLTGDVDAKSREIIHEINMLFGCFLQAQNDHNDSFLPEWKGKEAVVQGVSDHFQADGTDIRSGKRTWLAAEFLNRANHNQRAEFLANYGVDSLDAERRVQKLFADLNMLQAYKEYAKELHKRISDCVARVPQTRMHKPYLTLLNDMYAWEYSKKQA